MTDTVTILGRIGNDPVRSSTNSGVPVVTFRLASTQRRYDRKTDTWVDSETNWYTVSAYRQLAEHAKSSLHIGDGVIVAGRLRVRNWEANGRKGTSVDIDAETIGHDLRWGSSAFAKAPRATVAPETRERDVDERPETRGADAEYDGGGAESTVVHHDEAGGEIPESVPESTVADDAWATV